MDFNDNCEDYFKTLQRWKLEEKERFLPKNFKPRRHDKILGLPERPLIREWFF